MRQRWREYYRRNPDRVLARWCQWQQQNPEAERRQGREYYRRHPDKLLAKQSDRTGDGFQMSLLGGGIQARPWSQDSAWLTAFGILAPRIDWIPSWFPSSTSSSPPRTWLEDADLVEAFLDMLGDVDRLIGALDSWKKPPQPQCSSLWTCRRSTEKSATHSIH